jgi:hypothetical protein
MRRAVALATANGRSNGAQSGEPWYSPTSIFRTRVDKAELEPNQEQALKLANQFKYGEANYTYNGEPAPKFYGYSGVGYGLFTPNGGPIMLEGSYPVYRMPASHPREKITLVNGSGEPLAPGAKENLQAPFEAVPIPSPGTIAKEERLQALGTDEAVVFWCPETDEMWACWRFGGSPGAWTFQVGEYIHPVSTFDGILANPEWGVNAVGLGCVGGLITMQDLVDVLRGGQINHALALSACVLTGEHVAPASKNDDHEVANTVAETPEKTPNPAHGLVDAISEGARFRLKPTLYLPAVMPAAGPISLAIGTALQRYGCFVMNGSSGIGFYTQDPRSLGTPWSTCKWNPFATATHWASKINRFVSSACTDPSLPTMTDKYTSETKGVLDLIPWQYMELVKHP